MRLRTRILLASGLLIATPLLLLAAGVRGEMQRRLTSQYTARVNTLAEIIAEDLGTVTREVTDLQFWSMRLTAISTRLTDAFRRLQSYWSLMATGFKVRILQ